MKTLLRRLYGKQKPVPPTDLDSYDRKVSALRQQLPDATDQDCELIAAVQHLTMTSPERILALVNAVSYLATNQIEGDFVCLLYTSPSPRDATLSRMPSSA